MAKNSSKQWSPAEDKRLLELHAAGKSWVRIGAALKRSTAAIGTRLKVLRTNAEGDGNDPSGSPIAPKERA
jgi:photosystem II stability/assembly factor-like uncharacterized protein